VDKKALINKSNLYVTDDYVDDINHILNNNLSLSKYIDDNPVGPQYNQRFVDKIIQKNEKYIRLEGEMDHLIFTSYGRLINTTRESYIKPGFTPHTILYYVNGIKIDVKGIFKEQGWDFNHKKILKRFLNNMWPIQNNVYFKKLKKLI
tara:strand:+ start:1025 stop:1468 length:444 start_codon:yes stop_codon:yes gene_type:complete